MTQQTHKKKIYLLISPYTRQSCQWSHRSMYISHLTKSPPLTQNKQQINYVEVHNKTPKIQRRLEHYPTVLTQNTGLKILLICHHLKQRD